MTLFTSNKNKVEHANRPRVTDRIQENILTVTGIVLLLAATGMAWHSGQSLAARRGKIRNRLTEWNALRDIARTVVNYDTESLAIPAAPRPVDAIREAFSSAGIQPGTALTISKSRTDKTKTEFVRKELPKIELALFECTFSTVRPDNLMQALQNVEQNTLPLRIIECRLSSGQSNPPDISGTVIVQAISPAITTM